MNTSARIPKILLLLMLLSVVLGGGWFYREQERAMRLGVETDLSSIALLKARQITDWREERLGDAGVLRENPFLVERAARFLTDPRDENCEELRAYFRSLQKHYKYSDVQLVDLEGRERLSLSGQTVPHGEYASSLASALRDRKPVLTELYRVEGGSAPLISAIAPLFIEKGVVSNPIGAVVLVCDASRFLYPLIQSWPTPSKSAETLLIRRDADSVLFLNNLRHQPDTALKLRIPLSRKEVPAVMAVNGMTGVFDGLDYRGIEVLTALQPIPDTSWFMVAKMDKAEAFAGWRFRSVFILAFLLGMVGAIVILGLAIRQREIKNHYRALYLSEAALRASGERNSTTLKSIGDAVIATDARGLVELMNPVAEVLTGWTNEEAAGRPLDEVFRILNEHTRQTVENPICRVLHDRIVVDLGNHTLLIAKDGTERCIADSGAPIYDEKGDIAGVVLVFRDQTADRAAQKALLDSEIRYRGLFESARDGILILDGDTGHVVDANPSLLGLLGCSYDELHGKGLWEINFFKNVVASPNAFRTLQEKEYFRYEDLPLETGDGRHINVEFNSNVYLVDYGKVIQCNIRDITQRKQAEASLKEESARRRILFEQSPDGILIIDPRTTRFVDFNTAAHRQLGYSREEFARLTIFDVEADETAEEMKAKIADVIRHGKADFETIQRTRQGEIRNVHVTAQIVDVQGRPTYHCIWRDITERKRAEEALHESERQVQLLGKILELASLPFAIGYPDGRIGIVNRAFCGLTGYDDDELHAMAWNEDLTPVEWRESEERVLQELVSTGETVQYEKEYIRKGGTRIPVELLVHAVNDTQGRLEFFYAFVTDISERKRIQQELRKLSIAVEQSPVSVEITDLKGNIEYVNPKFTEITGYTLEEVRGQNPRILKSGETPDDEYRGLWETITSGGEWHGEFHNKRKDGSLFWERVSISSIRDSSGTIAHFIAVKEDISAQKALENQFRQAQKMEAVGRLAGGVAHDFNNMLGVVIGYAEMAQMRISPSDPTYREFDEILRAAKRSAGLVRQLLAFARQQTVEPRVLNLNHIISESEKMLRRLVGEDISVRFIPGDHLWKIRIDPAQVDQILANLTVNARDAMPGTGNICIETQNVVLDEAYCAGRPGFIPGEYVVLVFSDSGAGMDRGVLEHIFEPFFTTKEAGRGTGLGLSTIYGITKQNKGFVNVYSELGQGTTFKIYFPACQDRAEEETRKTEAVVLTGAETILVVEDDRQILALTVEILASHGYTVISAGFPGEALALCEKHPGEIHMLITDVVMPAMNGRELKERMEKLKPGIKVLYMSGYTADVIANRGVLSEGVRFIQKPFSVHILLRKVREALEQ